MTTEQRLDRVERILENLAANQAADQEIRLQTSAAIAQLTANQAADREIRLQTSATITQLSLHIDQVTTRLDGLGARVDQLTVNVDRLTTDSQELRSILMHSIENAEQDREVIRENQAEIRRIGEYLLGQQRNGDNRSE